MTLLLDLSCYIQQFSITYWFLVFWLLGAALIGGVTLGFVNPSLGGIAHRYHVAKFSTFGIFIISGKMILLFVGVYYFIVDTYLVDDSGPCAVAEWSKGLLLKELELALIRVNCHS